MCQDVCFAGSGKAHLEIQLASDPAAPPSLANEKLFAAARARLPRPWTEPEGAETTWSGTTEKPVLTIAAPNVESFELFPLTSRTTSVEKCAVEKGTSSATLTVDLRYREISPAEPPRVQGVLVVKTVRGQSSFQLNSICNRKLGESRSGQRTSESSR